MVNVDLEEIGQRRSISQRISKHLEQKLTGYLSTLQPLFSPRKVLGEYLDSAREGRIAGAEQNVAVISEQFKTIAEEAFGLSMRLGTQIPSFGQDLAVRPWEYLHKLDSGEEITITSPVRWVLSFRGDYGLSELLKQRIKEEKLNEVGLHQLMVRNLTLRRLLDSAPNLAALFEDLRFPMSVETSNQSGELPYTVVNCDVPSFCPQDDVIRTVVSLSGKPVFEELVDSEALQKIQDPFRDMLLEDVD